MTEILSRPISRMKCNGYARGIWDAAERFDSYIFDQMESERKRIAARLLSDVCL